MLTKTEFACVAEAVAHYSREGFQTIYESHESYMHGDKCLTRTTDRMRIMAKDGKRIQIDHVGFLDVQVSEA